MSSGDCDTGPNPNNVGYDVGGSDGTGDTSLAPGGGTTDALVNLCDLDIENNVWVEGVVDLSARPQKRGICMLNTMSREQIIHVLQHDPRARLDLCRVTSNAELLTLVNQVKLLRTDTRDQVLQSNNVRNGLPFYNQFRGNPPQSKK